MKELVLSNNKKIELTDGSSILESVTVVNTFAEIDDLRENFTAENYAGATFDGVTYNDVLPVAICADAAAGDKTILVKLTARGKTTEEKIEERLTDIENALIALA